MDISVLPLAATTSAIQVIVSKYLLPALSNLAATVSMDFKKTVEPLGTHFSDYLSRSYDKYGTLNTLVFRNQQKKLRDLYIPLSLVREGVKNPRNEDAIIIDGYPIDFISQYRRILITDTAGMGKSTLTKIMFLSAIDKEAGIPFYVELRKLTKSHSLLVEIRDQLNSLTKEFNDDLMRALFQSGGFIFFFDGFDEIALSDRDAVIEDIKRFIDKAPDNYYILTSRYEQSLAGFGDFLSMRIRPLTMSEAYDLLRRYDSNGDTSARLIEKLKSRQYAKIKDFLTNPLLVSLLFIGFDYKPEIPLKIHLFYDQVFDAYFNSHDLSKDGHYVHEKKSGLDMADFLKVMRAIGFICLKHRLEFSREDFLDILERAGKLSCVSIGSTERLMYDLLHAVPLFCQDGVNYKWVHKSMQEYYAADYIYRDSGSHKEAVLGNILNSQDINKYINLLEFYSDLDSKCFNQIFVLPVLNDFIEYVEKPIETNEPEMEKRIRLRRQIIYGNDVYLYFFSKEESKMQFSEMFQFLYNLVDPDSSKIRMRRSVVSHFTAGTFIGIVYISTGYGKLVDLIIKKYPEVSAKIKEPFSRLSSSLTHGELYHLTEDCGIDNPKVYDELNSMLSKEIVRFMDYERAKNICEEINKTLFDNEDVFKDLVSL